MLESSESLHDPKAQQWPPSLSHEHSEDISDLNNNERTDFQGSTGFRNLVSATPSLSSTTRLTGPHQTLGHPPEGPG